MASPTSTTSDMADKDWTDDATANYDFVRFTLADIHGIPRSKLIPRRHVADKLKTGITMVAGYLAVVAASVDVVLGQRNVCLGCEVTARPAPTSVHWQVVTGANDSDDVIADDAHWAVVQEGGGGDAGDGDDARLLPSTSSSHRSDPSPPRPPRRPPQPGVGGSFLRDVVRYISSQVTTAGPEDDSGGGGGSSAAPDPMITRPAVPDATCFAVLPSLLLHGLTRALAPM